MEVFISSVPIQVCSSYRLEIPNMIYFSAITEEKERSKRNQNLSKIRNRKHEGTLKKCFLIATTFHNCCGSKKNYLFTLKLK